MGRLLDFSTKLIESKHMVWGTAVVSFMESTFLPITIEIILIPVMVRNRSRWPGPWLLATSALVGSVLGGLAGYAVGYFLWDSFGSWAAETMGWSQHFQEYRDKIDNNGFLVVLSVGLTPVPFQVATLAAGAAAYNIALFILAIVIARGVRYFALALLVQFMGDKAEAWVNKHPFLIIGGGIVLLIVVYAIVKFAT